MKRIMCKYTGLLCCVLMQFCFVAQEAVYAQNASDDFKKISSIIHQAPVSFQMEYQMYAQHTGETKIQTKYAEYALWQNKLWYKMNDVELVANDRFTLSVDNGKKTIVLNKYNAAFEKKMQKEMEKFNIDSLLAKNSETKLISQSETQRIWRVIYKRPIKGIAYLDLVVQLPDYYMQKVTLYYARSFNDIYGLSPKQAVKADKPRLEITYRNFKTIQEEDQEMYFSAKQILSVDKKGKVILTPKYKQYQVANYYNINK